MQYSVTEYRRSFLKCHRSTEHQSPSHGWCFRFPDYHAFHTTIRLITERRNERPAAAAAVDVDGCYAVKGRGRQMGRCWMRETVIRTAATSLHHTRVNRVMTWWHRAINVMSHQTVVATHRREPIWTLLLGCPPNISPNEKLADDTNLRLGLGLGLVSLLRLNRCSRGESLSHRRHHGDRGTVRVEWIVFYQHTLGYLVPHDGVKDGIKSARISSSGVFSYDKKESQITRLRVKNECEDNKIVKRRDKSVSLQSMLFSYNKIINLLTYLLTYSSTVYSRRPVVVPVQCPHPKPLAPPNSKSQNRQWVWYLDLWLRTSQKQCKLILLQILRRTSANR